MSEETGSVFDTFQREISRAKIEDLCDAAGVPDLAPKLNDASIVPMALVSLMASAKNDFMDAIVSTDISKYEAKVLFAFLNARYQDRLRAAFPAERPVNIPIQAELAEEKTTPDASRLDDLEEKLQELQIGGENSTVASLFLKGLLTYVGPDDLKNKAKLVKLRKAALKGQTAPESEFSQLMSMMSTKGGMTADDAELPSLGDTKRSAFKARVRKGAREFQKFSRQIREVLAAESFESATGSRDFVQLDRWVKLSDLVQRVHDRDGWKIAAEYLIEFLEEHAFELILPAGALSPSFSVLVPEILQQVRDEHGLNDDELTGAAPKERKGKDNQDKEKGKDWKFTDRCLVCFGLDCVGSRKCPKRKNIDDKDKCPVCGENPACSSLVACAFRVHRDK